MHGRRGAIAPLLAITVGGAPITPVPGRGRCNRSSHGGMLEGLVLEAFAPPVLVTLDAKAPVEGTSSLVALEVSPDVVSEKVVSQQDVSGLAKDLDRLGPGDRG